MKKLGIIGGAGPLASALLYETIIKDTYLYSPQMPEIFLINYPFTRGLTIQEGKENEKILRDELQRCIKILVQNDVKIGMLACNTLHLYLQSSSKAFLPFLSIPSLVMKQARDNRHYRLLLLGTQNTCRSNLYQHSEIEIVYPSLGGQEVIDGIIDHVLEGKIYQEDSGLISQLIEHLSHQISFDGVILGCTDLPVLHDHFPIFSNKPLYDSIKIPAKIVRDFL